jgi:hypothetical protein
VTGDDVAGLSHQDRVGEAEFSDAGGDLLDLFSGVRSRITGVRPQRCRRAIFDDEQVLADHDGGPQNFDSAQA